MFSQNISHVWNNIQYELFPYLENNLGILSPEHKKLAAILELIRIEDFIPSSRFNFGRPLKDRIFIARAFIAKIIFKFTYTKHFIKYLKKDIQLKSICGWDRHAKIPSESMFSRAFKDFAKTRLPELAYTSCISKTYKNTIVGHVVRDSTPIESREKFLKKKGSRKERKKQLDKQYLQEKKNGTSRKQKQLKQDLEISLNELPKSCDIGSKKGPQGHVKSWKGYKLHLAVDDRCVPIAAILTSASLNDSEAAIPLGEKAKFVDNLYDLMDAGYDEDVIKEHSRSLGRVPIIDKHSRSKKQKAEKKAEEKRKKILNFSTAEDFRYKLRFPKERANALLKDNFGGRNIQYKGPEKVFCHLMFSIIALGASIILNL